MATEQPALIPNPNGVWAAYAYDATAYLISVHRTEVEALRAAVGGMGHAVFLPWGKSLAEAIKEAGAA